jgi:alkanesulfonate monooxygenase SsuD/methylene tetrahydromethanopterin reductase-like flavin-dependent oxidoreductase (luciferase family)
VALGLRDNTTAIIKAYRDTRAKLGRDPEATLIGVSRHVVVADTDAEALAIARRAYPRWRESFRRHGAEPRVIGIYPETFDALMELGNGIAGSPQTVRRWLADEIAANQGNYFAPHLMFGDYPVEQALRSIELFATKVMPEFAS